MRSSLRIKEELCYDDCGRVGGVHCCLTHARLPFSWLSETNPGARSSGVPGLISCLGHHTYRSIAGALAVIDCFQSLDRKTWTALNETWNGTLHW